MYDRLLFAFVFLCLSLQAESVSSSVYAQLLGKENASVWYQSKTAEALADFGVDASKVQVKRMNGFAPKLIGEGLYSFSCFDVWYNESLLNACPENERLFAVYHEAAHIALGHHTQDIALLSAWLAAYPISYWAYSTYDDVSYLYYVLAVLGTYAASTLFAARSRDKEKQADLYAVEKLVQLGKKDIILSHLHVLQHSMNAGDGEVEQTWHYSPSEQYAYIKESLASPLATE